MKKKKNVQDATLKNIRVLKRQLASVENELAMIFELLQGEWGIFPRLNGLEARVYDIDKKIIRPKKKR